MASRAERSRSFGGIAADYDRLRPPPADAAVDWLVPAQARTLVDLGEYEPDKDKQKDLYAEAKDLATKAVALKPTDPEAHFSVARAVGRVALSVGKKERVRFAFIVQRIAEQEKIQVSQEDAMRRAQSVAMMNQIPLEQFIKDLQQRNGVNELYEQVLHEKVLELLEKNATITEITVAQ